MDTVRLFKDAYGIEVAIFDYDGSLNWVLDDVLKTLTEKESRTLKLYYGWKASAGYDLNEIAKLEGRCRETIRRRRLMGLRKLRHPIRSRRLKLFIVVPASAEV